MSEQFINGHENTRKAKSDYCLEQLWIGGPKNERHWLIRASFLQRLSFHFPLPTGMRSISAHRYNQL